MKRELKKKPGIMLKVRARVRRRWCGARFALYYYSRFSIPLHIQLVIRKYFIQFFIFVLQIFLLQPVFFCISREWRIFWLASNSPIFIMPPDCISRIYYYWARSTEVLFFVDFSFTKSNNKSLINYLLLLLSSKVLAERKIAKLKVDYIVPVGWGECCTNWK